MKINNKFKNKSIVITGHTGFKGTWLVNWLYQLGGNITGIALDPPTNPSHFNACKIKSKINDIRINLLDQKSVQQIILDTKPDYVFHLAAQGLVRNSYNDPVDTWKTNVLGTLNVLESLRKLNKKCAAVMITTDKCYDNKEWVWGYRETDSLGGPDPYSASKAASELVIRSHIKSFFNSKYSKVRIASARAGNVIGGGDWAADRIVPDCVRAWSKDKKVKLRNPNSTRPWQHVLEPLSGYLVLAIGLLSKTELHGEPFNFGPIAQQNHSVLELVKNMSRYWKKVRWENTTLSKEPYESDLLKLNCDKALYHLYWKAVMEFEETVKMTSNWYKSFYRNKNNIQSVTNNQIKEYTKMARKLGLLWAQN